MPSLIFKNTQYSYGLIAIALHWIVAFAFIANYLIIYYKSWFVEPKADLGRTLFSYHTAIGVSVIVFVVLRIIWKLMSQQPKEVPGSKLEHLAAHGAHILLYICLLYTSPSPRDRG